MKSKGCFYCGKPHWKVKIVGKMRHKPICENCLKFYVIDRDEEGEEK